MYAGASGPQRAGEGAVAHCELSRLARLAVPALCVSLSLATPVFATSHDLCAPGFHAPLGSAEFLRSYRPGLHAPARLALDGAGNLYVSDPARNEVVVRASDGRLVHRQPFAAQPQAVAVDDSGGRPLTVYVSDSAAGRVTAYSANWEPLFELGQGAGEFLSVSDIAVEPSGGKVYVADGEADLIRIFAPGGSPLGSFGGHGAEPGAFDFPGAIAVDPVQQEVLVADQLNFRIQIFDLDGTFVCRLGDANGASPGAYLFGTRARLLTVPQGIALDSDGRIYVADVAEGRVRVVGRDGSVLGAIGGFGDGRDQLRAPLDLAIDAHGRLFVSDSNNGRLAIYGLESFTDPETHAPAEAVVTPDPFDHLGTAAFFSAIIEIQGYRLEDVVPGSITANGVPADAGSEEIGDRDADLQPDLEVTFDRDALAATLPAEGSGEIVVEGRMAELDFQAIAVIGVTGGVVDGDGDGLTDDIDRCLDTPAGSPVDSTGCAIAQLCPCGGQLDGAPWANRGDFVSCTAEAARRFVDAGLIGRAEIGGIVRAAAVAQCPREG